MTRIRVIVCLKRVRTPLSCSFNRKHHIQVIQQEQKMIKIKSHPNKFFKIHRISRNKRSGRLIFRNNKKHSKPHQNPSAPPFEKSRINIHRFCVLPPLKNHPSKSIGFVYSSLRKIIHQNPSVPCTPPFEKSRINIHRFCVLPPLKNHPSKPIGFVYSSLRKIIHQNPSVLCTPPFEKSLINKTSRLS